MKYDDASWHYEGDFPAGLPQENGATHIGMFLGWALTRGYAGEDLTDDEDVKQDIESVVARKMSPRDFLIKHCDEQLTEYDLSEPASEFAAEYYEETGTYYEDYNDAFPDCESLYELEDTWENFDKIAPVIDKRFAEWLKENK